MRLTLLTLMMYAASGLFMLTLAGVLAFLLFSALPHISLENIFGDTSPLAAIFHGAPVWDALWPAMAGTVRLLALTMLLALPLGISSGVFLAELAPPRLSRWCISAVEMLAGVPSIVMGFFGFISIILLRKTLLPSATTGLAPAALCLALLVLPVLTLTVHAALRSLPHELRLTAASLGLPRHVAIWRVFVPAAGKGIVSGCFLAAGRCAEDTSVILMTGAIANASVAPGLFSKFEALPFFIYYTTANYSNEQQYLLLFVAAFFLLLLACMLILLGMAFQRGTFREWNT